MSGGGYTDVKALHRLLMMELNMLQGTGAAGQRQSVLEVGVVSCKFYVHKTNDFYYLFWAKCVAIFRKTGHFCIVIAM